MTHPSDQRWHGLDAVRGLALVAGVVLHAAMAFLPGPQLWLVADPSRSAALSVVFFTIHMGRMTVFFVLAGFFGRLVHRRLGTLGFAKQRVVRIGVPLVVAWPLVLGAIGAVLDAGNPGGEAGDAGLTAATFPLAHLWFLYVLLWLYAGALLVRGAVAAVDRNERFRGAADTVMRALIAPWAPIVLALPVGWWLYGHPYWMMWFGVPTPDTGLLPHRASLLTYGLAFAVGWLLHRQAGALLPRIERHWALFLAMALAATVGCLAIAGIAPLLVPAPFGTGKLRFAALYAFGLWSWTLALLGLGLRFLATPSPTRRYLADASYWIYLAHLPLVIWLQLALRDWPLAWFVKFPLLLGAAMALLLLSYHWLVRPTFVGALLNGRRHPRGGSPSSDPGTVLMRAAVLLFIPGALLAQAPSAPKPLPLTTVLAKYAEASGPIATVTTRKVAMRVAGLLPDPIPVTSEAMRPNLLRKSVTLAGAVQVTATDGSTPWRIDPFASRDGKPMAVPAAELDDFLEEADFDGPLVDAAKKGITLSYAGPGVVKVRGTATPVHSVGVRWANGRTATVHLDATSFLEVQRVQQRPVMGRAVMMTITPSDFRRVGGLLVPYAIEIAPEGAPQPIRLTIESVELNLALERARFRRP